MCLMMSDRVGLEKSHMGQITRACLEEFTPMMVTPSNRGAMGWGGRGVRRWWAKVAAAVVGCLAGKESPPRNLLAHSCGWGVPEIRCCWCCSMSLRRLAGNGLGARSCGTEGSNLCRVIPERSRDCGMKCKETACCIEGCCWEFMTSATGTDCSCCGLWCGAFWNTIITQYSEHINISS